jgi:hypothetical protein
VRLRWQEAEAGRGRAVSLQVSRAGMDNVGQADYFFPPPAEWPEAGLEHRAILRLPRDLLPGAYALRAVVYQADDLAPVGAPQTLAVLNVAQPAAFVIQHAQRGRLGDNAELLGYDVDLSAAPGESLPLTLYWRRLAAFAGDYTVFVHLRRPDGTVLAQQDNPPRAGSYRTSAWQPGETILDRYALTIPPGTAPGEYTLAVGMYLPGANTRLPAHDAQGNRAPDDSLRLGTVTVVPD